MRCVIDIVYDMIERFYLKYLLCQSLSFIFAIARNKTINKINKTKNLWQV